MLPPGCGRFYNDDPLTYNKEPLAHSKKDMNMKSRAAVAFAAGKPLEIVAVDLEGPKSGEVLVEIMATGICHTDAFTLSGDDPEGAFPAILGHEGAGIVREVGPNVSSVRVGDAVIPLYTPECLSLIHISEPTRPY